MEKKNKLEVGFWGESDCYYVIGDCNKKEAIEAIRKYSKEEEGITDEEELESIPPQSPILGRFRAYRDMLIFNRDYKVGKKGWIAFV